MYNGEATRTALVCACAISNRFNHKWFFFDKNEKNPERARCTKRERDKREIIIEML